MTSFPQSSGILGRSKNVSKQLLKSIIFLKTDAAALQQASVNQAANRLLQQQAEAMYGISNAAGRFNPASYLLAHQIPAGVAQLQQSGGNHSTDQQQQLASLLQQQLWGMGLSAVSNPLLAQSLDFALQHNATGIPASANPHNSNPASAQQGVQGLLNSSSLFAARNAAFAIPSIVSNAPSAVTGSNNGTSSDSNHQTAGVHCLLNTSRGLGLQASQHQNGEQQENEGVTGRLPLVLYVNCDDDSLSEYQCLVRKQIELFEAGRDDVGSNAQGRNRPIVIGQVGIRCRHCTMLPPKHRARGAIYYPAKLTGIYQAAQNMASAHLGEHCQHVPVPLRNELNRLRDRKSSAGGGKKYWADGVRVLGVYEDEDGLRFENR